MSMDSPLGALLLPLLRSDQFVPRKPRFSSIGASAQRFLQKRHTDCLTMSYLNSDSSPLQKLLK